MCGVSIPKEWDHSLEWRSDRTNNSENSYDAKPSGKFLSDRESWWTSEEVETRPTEIREDFTGGMSVALYIVAVFGSIKKKTNL